MLLDFERTWLGLEKPPLADRLAEANWTPDAPHCYCGRCGATVGPHDADDTGCSTCRGKQMAWDRLIRLGPFNGVLREMVLEVKFTRWRQLGHGLGRLLGIALARALEDNQIAPEKSVLVPVPMSTRRRMTRGIDHSMVIARGVSEESGAKIVRALERQHRPAQARLPARQRQTNLEGAIRPKTALEAELVIVVDDVTTTRATMTAACKAVRKALGAEREATVWGAVLGVTPPQGGK